MVGGNHSDSSGAIKPSATSSEQPTIQQTSSPVQENVGQNQENSGLLPFITQPTPPLAEHSDSSTEQNSQPPIDLQVQTENGGRPALIGGNIHKDEAPNSDTVSDVANGGTSSSGNGGLSDGGNGGASGGLNVDLLGSTNGTKSASGVGGH